MATIRPFKAFRPEVSLAARCAALPYDVYNSTEARKEVDKEPLLFLAIDRPETQFEVGHDMYADDVYQKAHDLLWQRIGDGTYVQDSVPCFYVYEQTMNGRTQTGLVGCASVDDYINNVMKILLREKNRIVSAMSIAVMLRQGLFSWDIGITKR